jgi:hypothetical protein
MKEDRMWTDIGPEKAALLRRLGFNIVGMQFVDRVNRRTLEFEHVRDSSPAELRSELTV